MRAWLREVRLSRRTRWLSGWRPIRKGNLSRLTRERWPEGSSTKRAGPSSGLVDAAGPWLGTLLDTLLNTLLNCRQSAGWRPKHPRAPVFPALEAFGNAS